jgi:hypothetical protein
MILGHVTEGHGLLLWVVTCYPFEHISLVLVLGRRLIFCLVWFEALMNLILKLVIWQVYTKY